MNNYAAWWIWVDGIHGAKRLEDLPEEDQAEMFETMHTTAMDVACEFMEQYYSDNDLPYLEEDEEDEYEVWLINPDGNWERVLVTVEVERQFVFVAHKLALEAHVPDAATQTGMYDGW